MTLDRGAWLVQWPEQAKEQSILKKERFDNMQHDIHPAYGRRVWRKSIGGLKSRVTIPVRNLPMP